MKRVACLKGDKHWLEGVAAGRHPVTEAVAEEAEDRSAAVEAADPQAAAPAAPEEAFPGLEAHPLLVYLVILPAKRLARHPSEFPLEVPGDQLRGDQE